nr:hypothetical protein [Nocardia arizonensis]
MGAGSGLSTVTLVDALPGVAIHAVEPSAAMRAALVSRILAHADAADRVTVHAEPVEEIDLPDRLGAVAMMGVIGYLDPDVRPRTAQDLAEAAGAHPDATFRLMRAAVGVGLASYDDLSHRFETTALLDRLRADAPNSLRNLAIVRSAPGHGCCGNTGHRPGNPGRSRPTASSTRWSGSRAGRSPSPVRRTSRTDPSGSRTRR